MSPVEPSGDGDNGGDDSDVMEVSDAEEDDKDNQHDEVMEDDVSEDDESNDDDGANEEDNGNGGKKGKGDGNGGGQGKKDDSGIMKKSKAEEPRVEEPPAAPAAMIDEEDEHVVYFYRRSDPTRKLYQLPLYKADTWMGLRRYLGPLVSQTGRFKIYGPDDRQISEVFWKPYPKDGKTFSFAYSELVFATVISTNSTAPTYSVFTMTITERTLVHELRSLIQWEMRRHMWRTPEKADDLELDVFLIVNDRPCVARMTPHHLVGNYLQGKSEQLKIKVRNMELRKEGEMAWPEWNETMYWG